MSDEAPAHGITRPAIECNVIAIPPKMTEQAFQDAVVYVARMYGWHAAHFRPSRTASSWATAVAYDGKGFPDLVLVNPQRKLTWFVECKSETGTLSNEQDQWGAWLTAAGQHWFLWRPKHWTRIVELLSDGRATG